MKLTPLVHNCPHPDVEIPPWLKKIKLRWKCEDCGQRWRWKMQSKVDGPLKGTLKRVWWSWPNRKWKRTARRYLWEQQRFGD